MTLEKPEVEPTERLSPDDQATLRETQFRDAALARIRQAAQAERRPAGICANCGECCLPLALYCDEDCRADDEHRQATRQRQGLAR